MSTDRKFVIVIGTGGREGALARAFQHEADVLIVPSHSGIPNSANLRPEEQQADLFVIGPENKLVGTGDPPENGLADILRAQGKLVVGPGALGAQLEGSKKNMKELLRDAGVPTANFSTFEDPETAAGYIESLHWSLIVVKTDGLAAGKGVCVTASREKAIKDAQAKLSGEAFGDAGRRVVIEEGHFGPELSVIALLDGTEEGIRLFPHSRDHKRLNDGDTGPMTGGMGAYSPVDDAPGDEVLLGYFRRIVRELRRRNIDYRGFMYLGLMLTSDGPIVLEINVRFGDPEAQAVLPNIKSGFLDCCMEVAAGNLTSRMEFEPGFTVTVALAAEGYPDSKKLKLGHPIGGLQEVMKEAMSHDVMVFLAGVERTLEGWYKVAGGRVLYISARGDTLEEARSKAYAAIHKISWPGMQFRSDIGVPR